MLSIAAVERDTGLSKDTLRVWERRYGFPQPSRDAYGERAYPPEQVERLRLIRRLMDSGHRPGKILPLSPDDLRALAAASSAPPPDAGPHARLISLIREQRIADLRAELTQTAARLGLERFITEFCAPLIVAVGESWAGGQLDIVEEHLFTESMQAVLRTSTAGVPMSSNPPRVLLTTLPGEEHGLGLLMVESLLVLSGAYCLPLGTQTPVPEIAQACRRGAIDVVALSFSAGMNPNRVTAGLKELREALPPGVEIWAGGRCPNLRRRAPAGVEVITSLEDIEPAVRRWRAQRAGE